MPSFASITGHRRVTTLLSQAIARGTLAPTLLFVGPSGVGKHLVARATAAALNCLAPIIDANGLPFDACLTCRSCDRISRDVHVEVVSLEPDDRASIKIDVIRDVLQRTAFRPFEGRRRVIIIRDADALEGAAQNALLKSLEEPPPGTVFVLTTAMPDALLPTVRSRCMRLRFGRLTQAEVARVLSSDLGMPELKVRDLAALADGSVGQALAFESADVTVLRGLAARLLGQAAAQAPLATRLQMASAIVAVKPRVDRTREEVALILRFAASIVRDLELINATGDTGALANPSLADELGALAPAFRADRARDAFAIVDQGIAALGKNAGVKVVTEWVAVNL